MAANDETPTIETRIEIEALIDGLSRPAAHGLGDDVDVTVIQTHASAVFLAGDRVVKVKKAVHFWGLLDYSTFALRERYCHAEVEFNRRLAPDVYLGVEPIVRRDGALCVGGDGEVVEHAVIMRRIDESDTLKARLDRGDVSTDDVEAIADRIARFHDAHRRPDEDPAALVDRFDVVLARNFDGTPREPNALFPENAHRGMRRRLERRLARLRKTLEARVAAGSAVDGHGDLRLDHVLWTDDGWAAMDCVEFNPDLRYIDGASDLSFLSMDLQQAGYPELARVLERRYAKVTDDSDMVRVLPLFRAYRAYVRATVGYHTSQETEIQDAARAASGASAQRHFALAWTESIAGHRASLIVMRGTSGTGKSVLAGVIAPLLRADVIKSDVVRKALLGMDPTERPEGDDVDTVYSSAMSERTYREVLAQARSALEVGRTAILDATYLRADSRADARALADEFGAPFAILDITCPPDVIRERILARSARGDDASDANYDVYLDQVASAESLSDLEVPFAVPYDSTTPPEPALMDLVRCLEAQLPENPS